MDPAPHRPSRGTAPSRREALAGGVTALALFGSASARADAPSPADDDALLAGLVAGGGRPRIARRAAPYRLTRPLLIPAGTVVVLEAGARIRWDGPAGTMDDPVGVFRAGGNDTGVMAETGEAFVECAVPSPFVYAAMMRGMSGFTVSGLQARACQHVQVAASTPNYAEVSTTSIARNVRITGGGARFAALQHEGHGACAISFVDGCRVEDARYENTRHGVQWWGGNADPLGGRGEGVPDNERKCRNVTVERVSVRNAAEAGIWGSMGHGVVVRDCSVDGCGDVAFDAEGSTDVVFERCRARNGRNGCFVTFFLCDGVRFVDCTGVVDHRRFPLLRVYNSSQSNMNNRGLEVRGGRFECLDRAGPGTMDTASGPVQTIAITGARLRNVRIDLAYSNMHRTIVTGNSLDFPWPLGDVAAIAAGASKSIEGAFPVRPGGAAVTGNRITYRAAPPAGDRAVAIRMIEDDFNSAADSRVQGNVVQGPFAVGVVLVSASANGGIVPVFTVAGNRFAGLASSARLLRVERASPASHAPDVRWDATQTRDGRAVTLRAALG